MKIVSYFVTVLCSRRWSTHSRPIRKINQQKEQKSRRTRKSYRPYTTQSSNERRYCSSLQQAVHISSDSPCRFQFIQTLLVHQVPDEITKVMVVGSRLLQCQ